MFTNFKIMGLFYAASAYPWFYKFVRKSLEMMFARRSQNYDVIREIVQNRIKTNDSTKRDFWAYVLAHANKEDIREKELETTGWSIVIAGAETTSSLLAGVIYLLLTHAEHMQRLTAELRTRFASEKEITFDSVSRVPFLIAVLEETLRYYPPAPFGVSRVVTPPEGSQIDGFWLPQGTRISSSHYCLFRSPENFANPDQWVPERWLEDRDDLYEDDNRDALMPFSVGKRNCIGKRYVSGQDFPFPTGDVVMRETDSCCTSLAIVQMRLILARLLWNFDFELCDQSRDWMDQRTYMGWEKGPLLARVSDVKR
jgi:cytochrome P450